MKSTISVIIGAGLPKKRVLLRVPHAHSSLFYDFTKTLPLIRRNISTVISKQYHPHYNIYEYLNKFGTRSRISA